MSDVVVRTWGFLVGPSRRGLLCVVAVAVLVACAGGGGTPPPTGVLGPAVSIGFPYAGQVLAGTVAVAAGGVGGRATGLVFELGSLRVSADADGTATLNTRGLTDGSHVLRAVASVGGSEVRSEIAVVVDNDLASSGSVSSLGGALRTVGGSLAVVPPGALAASAVVSVRDTTQAEILDEFGVDYPALGVTFLGAMTVESDAPGLDLPLQVDLNGWAEAVQPGQQVVMFMLAPDASGNGVGELMFAANAQATPDGSVITRPSPRSEVYGFGGVGVARLQATAVGRPGEIVTLVGRGFNLGGSVSNVVRFSDGQDLLLLATSAEEATFNPLMELQFALPALGTTSHSVTLHNLTSGHRSDPITVGVGALGTGSAAVFAGFVDQVALAVERSTLDRQDLAEAAATWLAVLEASGSSVAAAMASNSDLVSDSNRALIDGIGSGSVDLAQRRLVERHALVLDAMAASVPEFAVVAADLATLLMAVAPLASSSGTVSALQAGGGVPCGATTSSVNFTLGVAGMGSASLGACNRGEFAGLTGVGGSGANVPEAVHQSASRRGGSLAPVAGALVTILYQGTTQRLSPFTAITDATGYYYIPFMPPGEPFTIVASDPVSGAVARAEGVTGVVNWAVTRNLTYVGGGEAEGRPTARFTITDEGGGTHRFDASGSERGDAEIVTYRWEFGDGRIVSSSLPVVTHTYTVGGDYAIRLVVVDEEGLADQAFGAVDLPPSYGVVLVRDHAFHPVLDGSGEVVALRAFTDGTYETSSGVLVHDLSEGTEVRADVAADGTASDGDIMQNVGLSRDGRHLTFLTFGPSNLAPDAPTGSSIFIKDLATGALESIDRSDPALPGTPACIDTPILSGDGRHVSFRARSCVSSIWGVYVKDLDAGSVQRVSGEFQYDAFVGGIDGDGSTIAYVAPDAGDSNGFTDVFVWEAASGTVSRASLAFDGSEADDHVSVSFSQSRGGVLSDDGRYLLLSSRASNLVPGITNDATDAFVRDLETGTIERVSLDGSGQELTMGSPRSRLSGDGRYLAFTSFGSGVAPEMSTYPRLRLFVRDLATGAVAWVDRTDLGGDHTMRGIRNEEFDISGNGRYLAFATGAQLVAAADPDSIGVYRVENPLWTVGE